MATSKKAAPAKKAAPVWKNATPAPKKASAPRKKSAVKQSQEPNPLEARMDNMESMLKGLWDAAGRIESISVPSDMRATVSVPKSDAPGKSSPCLTDLLKSIETTNAWAGEVTKSLHDRLDLLVCRKDELEKSAAHFNEITQGMQDALNRIHNIIG